MNYTIQVIITPKESQEGVALVRIHLELSKLDPYELVVRKSLERIAEALTDPKSGARAVSQALLFMAKHEDMEVKLTKGKWRG